MWKFFDFNITYTPFGIIINPFLILPGIIALLLTKTSISSFLNTIFKTKNICFYFISFVFNILNFAVVIIFNILFKTVKIENLINFETRLLGLFLDMPLFLIIWFPSIIFHEYGWRYLILENISIKSDLLKILFASTLYILSFLAIIIYLLISKNMMFTLNFTILIFFLSFVLNLLYIKTQSIFLSAFHHIIFIVLNSHVFREIFNGEVFYLISLENLNTSSLITVFPQILLIILLFWIVKKIKLKN